MSRHEDAALVDRIAETLRDEIARGEIAIGSHLAQEQIGARFGVSRTPVREALQRLEVLGLVELAPNRGALVRGFSERELQDAYVIRAELEGLAVELATSRITERQLGDLRASAVLFRSSLAELSTRRLNHEGDWSEAELTSWEQANNAFHRVIHEASGNDRLAAMLQEHDVFVSRNLTALALARGTTLIEQNVREHEAILSAIEANEPERARVRMRRHVIRAGELVLSATRDAIPESVPKRLHFPR